MGLNAVTVTGGRTQIGGGILNRGTLNAHGSTLTNNHAEFGGGGIFNGGGAVANVTRSTLTNNHAELGGGIFNGGVANVTGTRLTHNGSAAGGAIYNVFGSITLANSTLSAGGRELQSHRVVNIGLPPIVLQRPRDRADSYVTHSGPLLAL